jgi:hypothetical protein
MKKFIDELKKLWAHIKEVWDYLVKFFKSITEKIGSIGA